MSILFFKVQLEEAFFSGQPASIRKTVEFVSERIASACVKHICHEIVPEFKRKSLKELDRMLKLFGEKGEDYKEVCIQYKIFLSFCFYVSTYLILKFFFFNFGRYKKTLSM